jgi:hypothetical protein
MAFESTTRSVVSSHSALCTVVLVSILAAIINPMIGAKPAA